MNNIITLNHGSGGESTNSIINNIFLKHFNNEYLSQLNDATILENQNKKICFTTDSFVIDPIFFPGGDIGRLSICGTVNDLACMGAKPYYISCGFILEESFLISDLERIVISMADTAKEAGVIIVCGDTKVVQKGKGDKIFINTSGIGYIDDSINIYATNAQDGDLVFITGNIGDHGASVISCREELGFETEILSDVCPVNGLVSDLINVANIHVLRDPTRGGVATTLNEIATKSNITIEIDENSLPIEDKVDGFCKVLGFDPLYLANEGKLIIIAPKEEEQKIIECIRKHKYGKNIRKIGRVCKYPSSNGMVILNTFIGGKRILDTLEGEMLPRIC